MEFELYMVRHGETESNRTKILQVIVAWVILPIALIILMQGHLDIPLSQIGLEQARLVATHLAPTPFSLAISSDLSRALKTGEAIRDANNSFDEIEVWEVARERCFGEMQGQVVDVMLSAIKGKGPEGGETGEQFRERVRQFL
jgi:broad specificity phosphatase PhoE